MKSLLEYINESSDSQFFRFVFKGIDDKDQIIKSIETVGNQTGIYTERIDNGIKVKLTTDNKSNASNFIDVINGFIENKEESDIINSIKDTISKMQEFSEAEDGE